MLGTVEDVDLARLGYDDLLADWLSGIDEAGIVPARVARVDRGAVLVFTATGPCHLATRVPVSTGDWVTLSALRDRIVAVAPRRTVITRADPSRADGQVLAANVEFVWVVAGLDRPVRPGRLERACVLAWETGAEPRLVLTKADLMDDPEAAATTAARLAPGVPVHLTSAVTGQGLDGLAGHLATGRTTVLLGESGAGKSTLVNALTGADLLATDAVRKGDAKGRHTTTARHLVPLPAGGVLIDTPGLRQLGLWSGGSGLVATFADIEELAGGCQFADCAHGPEPGCAVQAAIADERLPARRLAGYEKLRRELEHAEGVRSEHERRADDRRFGKMAKAVMKEKGARRRAQP